MQHPRPHYAVLGILLGLVWLAMRSWRWAGLCLLLVVGNVTAVHLLTPPRAEVYRGDAAWRIVHLNLDRGNDDVEAVRDYLSQGQPPDIVCLQEFTPAWSEALARWSEPYEWVHAEPRDDSRGVAVLMRDRVGLEVERVEVLQWLPGEQDRPTLAVQLVDGDHRFTLLSLHTKRPRDAETSAIQRRELAAAAQWCRQRINAGHDLIVLGDFNATPWSSGYRAFASEADVHHAGGVWMDATYPGWLPRAAGLPIDLCAVSQRARVRSVVSGPHVGSDHRPLEVEVGWSER